MSKLVHNYNGGTTDEYGTDLILNRSLSGEIIEGFAVVANGTPNMTVLVQPGSGRVTTGTYPNIYAYLVSHDTTAGESVTISTAAASPRIDYIVAYIDKGVAGSPLVGNVNNTNNVLKFAAVAGTPAGSPLVPTVAQIQAAIGAANPYIILAQVAVAAGVTSISNTNITDTRIFAAARNPRALGMASYVDSGCVWAATSGLAAAMTAGVVYINVAGVMVPVSLAAIASNTFTANQDTYVDVNVLGTITYTGVTNNSASPVLAAFSVRLAIIVTGASSIASAGSINQGQEYMVLPIASSVAYSVTDSLGNLICPRDPLRKTLGYKQIVTTFSTSSTAYTQVLGLSATVIVPVGRKAKITAYFRGMANTNPSTGNYASIWDGPVGTGTQLQEIELDISSATFHVGGNAIAMSTPSTLSKTYNVGMKVSAGGANMDASTALPAFILVELA